MRLGSAEEYVNLDIWPRGSRERTGGDVMVNVAVHCDGFAGNASEWVLAQAWDSFVTEVRELERTRRGQAVLETDFGGHGFRLRLFATDLAGHMAASGMIRHMRMWQDAGALELSFGRIGFDPTALPDFLRLLESV